MHVPPPTGWLETAWTPVTCFRRDAAKEFLGNNGVDLVLSDFRLGDCNGVELLEWMRAHGYRMPFLVMTGYGDIPGAVEAVKKGADNYLPKPGADRRGARCHLRIAGTQEEKNKAGTGFLCLQKPAGCKTSGDGASGSSCGQPFRTDTRGVRYGQGMGGTADTRFQQAFGRPFRGSGLRSPSTGTGRIGTVRA